MSESAFRSSVRSATRGLWSGALGRSDFTAAMQSALKRHLTQAWTEGAAECSVKADELTEQETKALAGFIAEQIDFISGFADSIREHDKTSKGKLQPLFGRAELWINRYTDAKNRAKVMACADKKLAWVIGPTERHCRDCSKYDTHVYRGSVWGNIRPQHPNLACHGYRCKCKLNPTDKGLTRGKPLGMTG